MCRICALTNTDHAPLFRPMMLDRMMLMGNADRTPQKDGWGVTDGNHVFKAKDAYREYMHANWMEAFDTRSIWLGHVRHASANTALSDDAAHPYKFPQFIGVHNGCFQGTWREMPNPTPEGAINTDTWRAFYLLNKELESGKLLPDVVDAWLSRFDEDSAFVVMLIHNQQLHIIRGPKTRELYFGEHGNGLVFHTDQNVLKIGDDLYKWYSGEGIENITEFPELHYARLSPGEKWFEELRALDWKPAPKKTYVTTYTGAGARDASERQTDGRWVRSTIITQGDPKDVEKFVAWGKLWQLLYPMRQPLALYYIAEILRQEVQNFQTPDSYRDLLFMDIGHVTDYMKEHPFTDAMRKLLHQWNKIVEVDHEMLVYEAMFGEGKPFWELENGADILKELEGAK